MYRTLWAVERGLDFTLRKRSEPLEGLSRGEIRSTLFFSQDPSDDCVDSQKMLAASAGLSHSPPHRWPFLASTEAQWSEAGDCSSLSMLAWASGFVSWGSGSRHQLQTNQVSEGRGLPVGSGKLRGLLRKAVGRRSYLGCLLQPD